MNQSIGSVVYRERRDRVEDARPKGETEGRGLRVLLPLIQPI